MSDPTNRWLRIATPFALFVVALGMRLLSWFTVFTADGFRPLGNDAYYHLRRIRFSVEHFPELLEHDPLMGFPLGGQPIWSPTFDWLIAAVLQLVPGGGRPEVMEPLAAWVPPLLGAATVLLVYGVALRLYSRFVAVVSAGLLAVLPGHVYYSRIGFVDHHVLVSTLATVALFVAMRLFREPVPTGAPPTRLGLSVALGASMASLLLAWPGALLHVAVLQAAMVVRLVSEADDARAVVWADRFAVAHAVAGLAVAPLCLGRDWRLWGSLSPVVLSDFQPLYLFVGAFCFAALGIVWRRSAWASRSGPRGLSAGALGLVVLLSVLVVLPDLRGGLSDALAWLGKEERFQAMVNESTPLFGGQLGVRGATMFLSGFLYVVPVMIGFIGWRSRRRPDQLLLMGWSLAFFGMTLLQWRFVNTYSVAHALLIALTLEALWSGLSPRLVTPARRRAAVAVISGAVAVAFAFSLDGFRPNVVNVARGLSGREGVAFDAVRSTRHVIDAARFLRDHTPSSQPPVWSVLAAWGDGHLLKYVADRAVVHDNFGDDVAPENFERAEAYFASPSEERALEIVDPMAVRYVLVRQSGSGHRWSYPPASLFMRLHRMDGSRGRMPAGPGRRPVSVAALGRHRLVYESEPARTDPGQPYCRIYEIVAGAEVVGRAETGAFVTLSVDVETSRGRAFEWEGLVQAGPDGTYRVRVPYPNEPFSPEIRTGGSYTVRSGERSRPLVVPGSAVESGARVEGPDLTDESKPS